MSIKAGVLKASGVQMSEINAMDIFDFFILFHELDEKAEKNKVSGRRG